MFALNRDTFLSNKVEGLKTALGFSDKVRVTH